MKIFLLNCFALIFYLNLNISIANEQNNKLKDLYESGLLTKDEYNKAISKSDENKNLKTKRINIRKLPNSTGKEKFEKLEFYLDNYRIYTYRPGVINIDNMLTGQTDVSFGKNLKTDLTRDGNKYFNFILDENNKSGKLFYKDQILFNWSGKYVSRHKATFYQIQVLGYMPFHFYIMLAGRNPISINMDKFNKKIEKATNKVKEELAEKYNISVSDINLMMENKTNRVDNEIEKVVSAEKEKLIKKLTEKYAGKEITETIRKEIERTIGEELANAFISEIEKVTGQEIDNAIEQEIADAINEAINEAIQLGISEATAAAAIAAMIEVWARGGSDEEALDACRKIAGDAC